MVMSKAGARASEELLKLMEYTTIENLPHGELLEYSKAQSDTGVKMDIKGRSILYRALRNNNRTFLSIKNIGYQMASAENCMNVSAHTIIRVKNCVNTAKKVHSNLVDDFSDKLSPEEKQQLRFRNSFLGAIAESSNKTIGTKEIRKLAESNPIIPDDI